MATFFGIAGIVVIVAAVIYFYKHPSKPGAKPTEGIDYGNMGNTHDKKKE